MQRIKQLEKLRSSCDLPADSFLEACVADIFAMFQADAASPQFPVAENGHRLKTVPVLMAFENEDVIGELKINLDRLPLHDQWHLGIGYRVHEFRDGDVVRYELLCVGLVNEPAQTGSAA